MGEYYPPACDGITLEYNNGEYLPPQCDSIVLRFGELVKIESLVGAILISTETAQVEMLTHVLPSGQVVPSGGIRWGGNAPRQISKGMPWDRMAVVEPTVSVVHADTATHYQRPVLVPWGSTTIYDRHYNLPDGELSHGDRETDVPWVQLDVRDIHKDISWDAYNHGDRSTRVPYLEPGAKDVVKNGSFLGIPALFRDATQRVPWRTPGAKDLHHQTQWGPLSNFQFCFSKYWPPKCNDVVLEFEDGTLLPGVCEGLTIVFRNYADDIRCPYWHEHTGWRDRYPPVIISPIDGTIWPARLRTYVMINTILLKRLPDNAYFDALSVNMAMDIDSWLWSFNIELPSREYLDLIKPQGGTLIDVEISVNGWKWTCRVEGWTENRSFGRTTWTVTGRSPSAELGEPYCDLESFISIADTQGAQFVGDILQYSGWGYNWETSDWLNPLTGWLVPAGAFTFANATKISAIQQLAGSVGAVVQTPPDTVTEKLLKIFPRYRMNPWLWSGVTPVTGLIEDQCQEIGRSWDSRPLHNAVVVSGVNYGRIVSVKRSGTAGDLLAPTFTNDLITTDGAGSEAGRIIMGRSGRWVKHSLNMFSLYPQGTPPGLVLPGTMVSVSERGSAWKGQVIATSIGASTVSREVRQTLEVEEYQA